MRTMLFILAGLLAVGAMAPDAGRTGVLTIREIGEADGLGRDRDPVSGARTWSWRWGALAVDDTALSVDVHDGALILPIGPDTRGSSDGRRLRVEDGRYAVETPLLLEGRGWRVFATGGELLIDGGDLELSPAERRDPRADYLFFLGVLLATGVLLFNVRRRSRR